MTAGTPSPAPPQRVFLHVGAPKTGTTFLQTLLWDNRDELREDHGLLFPGARYDEHFLAAVDLQDATFHGDPRPDVRGSWDRVVEQALAWPGTTVISHEVFASASAEHAARAIAALAPAEVHVVYTARDLGRQLPSHWQEDVKHGSTDTFERWFDAVWRRDPSHYFGRWFWPTEDVPDVVRRWGDAVGRDRFHLVTVPRSGGPGVLWERYCGVIGLDPAAVDLDSATIANSGLGLPEVEVVRRVNELLDSTLSPVVHQHVVKGVLGHDTLVRHRGSRKLALPAEHLPAVHEVAAGYVAFLEASGVQVVGDLADLLPSPARAQSGHPDDATDAEVAEAAVWAVTELLVRVEQERLRHRAAILRLENSWLWLARRIVRPRTRLRTARSRLQGLSRAEALQVEAALDEAGQAVAEQVATEEAGS